MPAQSKAQQAAAGIALAARKRKVPVSRLQGAAKDMYESMSEEELRKIAHTGTSRLPKKVKRTPRYS